jgi:hypothetical protein
MRPWGVETQVRPSKQPITTPWIYHNSDLWLISLSSDWTTWLTIADKNLWATQVYNSWDTLSEANCGKYYQRWNSYWFAWTWSITTTSSTTSAWSYWPWNYYNYSTFRAIGDGRWDISENNNLRWDTTNTVEARQWPCSTWYHVPSKSDFENLINMWSNMWAWIYEGTWDGMRNYLKMPYVWNRQNGNASLSMQWTQWRYFSSTPDDTGYNAYNLFIRTDVKWIRLLNNYRALWVSIRPFKNEAVKPDNTRTVLYQPS